MDDGTKFTYKNPHGGYWYYDPEAPTGGAGRPNTWTPPVNESWPWGQQNMHGSVLLARCWLVLEPFISPAPFERYQGGASPVVDEWTLSQAMAADTANGGLNQLEDHYKTFITEKDFADIAGAGLTWIRLPVPFWAIDKLPEEPYLEKVAWTYFLKAITWARKYGLRINLDLHTIPGSQNGWNHSGKLGTMNWLQGVMGVANAQRSLNYIRFYTEFISQPEITSVVPMFGVVNEPRNLLDIHNIKRFYYEVYTMVRGITGIGKGPFISFHTAFSDGGFNNWLPNADRIMIDRHPYIIFGRTPTNNAPASYAAEPCNSWGSWANGTSSLFGLNSAGEFSAAINDCGLWVNEVGRGADYENQFGAGSCDEWNNWDTWTQARKDSMKTFAMASMESAQNWFFWTWRIGESLAAGKVLTPMWSYSLGLQNGWMPDDPRTVIGTCAGLGYGYDSPFDGQYQPWQTSGQGAVLAPSTTEDYTWPPPTLVDQANAAQLPTYTPTGELPKLPMPTGMKGTGWFNQQDTQGAYVPVSGCTYPDPWSANGIAIPAAC
ncbi:glycoside hydrolase [Auricularia subglabra TFB-10046 SS5]|nr:glycoside hydrolase [Auricularia subglabra TFB-10046 SS5]